MIRAQSESVVMVGVSATDSFRAQLMLPEQQQIYDYWCAHARADGTVLRSSIRPAEIPRLLPNISLIEIFHQPLRFRYRLAGSMLREIYDRDMTGLDVFKFGLP